MSHMRGDHQLFGGNPGEPVPTVDMEDLKSVWTRYRDIESAHPELKTAGVESTLIKAICSAGADIHAVMYRLWMLGFLEMIPGNLLGKWKENKRFDDTVFKIIARIPMKWMEHGVPQSELPFDVQSFLEELRRESPRPDSQ
jgi:hypothetical protein